MAMSETSLNYGGHILGEGDLRALAEKLKDDRNVTELSLCRCGITPAGAKILAEALRGSSTLKSVEIWGNKLGFKGRKILLEEGLRHNRSIIRYIDIYDFHSSAQTYMGHRQKHVQKLYKDILTYNETLSTEQLKEIREWLPAILNEAGGITGAPAQNVLRLLSARAEKLGFALDAPQGYLALPAPEEILATAQPERPEPKKDEGLLPEDFEGSLKEGDREKIMDIVSWFLDVDPFIIARAGYEDKELVRLFNRARGVHNERAAQAAQMEAESEENPEAPTSQALLSGKKFDACNASLDRLAKSVMQRAQMKAQP